MSTRSESLRLDAVLVRPERSGPSRICNTVKEYRSRQTDTNRKKSSVFQQSRKYQLFLSRYKLRQKPPN